MAATRVGMLALLGAAGAAGAAAEALAEPRAAGLVHFAPADSVVARRGRGVAERFALARRFELTLQVANAFSRENRVAVARTEAALATLPGVRRVIGPSRLLAVRVDAIGRVTASPLFAAHPPELAIQSQLGRRADALGWFLSPDGSTVRLLVDVEERPPSEEAVEAVVASSGLSMLAGEIPRRAVWPEPDRDRLPFGRDWPLELALLTALPLLVVALSARPSARRFAVGAVALAVTIAAPALAAPVAPIRSYGAATGAAAAGLAGLVWLATRFRRGHGRRQGGGEGRGQRTRRARAPSRAAGLARAPAPPRAARAPLAILVPSLLVVGAAAALAPGLELRSELSRETSLFFVAVRADVAEPTVLRELRRFTELLRAEPGVAGAWSVADLFAAIPRLDSGVGGIPDDRDTVLRLLRQLATDPAVALEVAPQLREALVVVRLEEGTGVDPSEVVDRAVQLAGRDLRRWLWRIEVTDTGLPLAARAFGRGLLAEDARARVARLSDRAGHTLDDEQRQDIDRSLRRVSLAPRVDPVSFRGDVTREVVAFLEEEALSEHRVAPPHPARQQKVIDAVLAIPGEPTLGEVSRALGEVGGPRPPATAAARDGRAAELRRRLVTLWRRAVTRLAAKTILADADLPTEGGLSDDVRDATLEVMGPVVGVPGVPAGPGVPAARGAPAAPGVFPLDAAVVGGAACDRALSLAWAPRMRVAITLAALALALLLFTLGGPRSLSWWPAALAPAAVVVLVPAVASIPMGMLFASVLAGALGGGALFGVAASGGERSW